MTNHGPRAVPAGILEATEQAKAYMPTYARLYLESLSWARVPEDLSNAFKARVESLMGTFNWAMKPSCQPLFRRWMDTKNPVAGLALSVVLNGYGKSYESVEGHLLEGEYPELLVFKIIDSEGKQIRTQSRKLKTSRAKQTLQSVG